MAVTPNNTEGDDSVNGFIYMKAIEKRKKKVHVTIVHSCAVIIE